MNLKNPIVVLANGSFPKSQIALNILKKAKSIICLDGATNKLIANNLEPTLIIGDLDSIKAQYKTKYKNIIVEQKNQNQNELRKALNWLQKNNYKNIKVLGASGEREDHFIGNIFGILDTDYSIDIQLVTDSGTFKVLKKGVHRIPSHIGQSVSFFTSKNWSEIRAPFKEFKKSNFYQPNNIIGQKIKSIGLVAGFDDFKSDLCLGEIGLF